MQSRAVGVPIGSVLFCEGVVCMRSFAKEFYRSKQWRQTRAYIVQRDMGLCTRCNCPGEIVHHKIPLTPGNLGNLSISLGEENLELLCRDCHGIAHTTDVPMDSSLKFDEEGNLVVRKV